MNNNLFLVLLAATMVVGYFFGERFDIWQERFNCIQQQNSMLG
jgi:hypothetical protein